MHGELHVRPPSNSTKHNTKLKLMLLSQESPLPAPNLQEAEVIEEVEEGQEATEAVGEKAGDHPEVAIKVDEANE